MRPREDVLAVVVSYNGADRLRETVDALRSQVARTLIVDNGSGPETQAVLEALGAHAQVVVERLGVNRGIGFALNRGVAAAQAGGFAWMLTMDQDSVADAGMLEAFARAVEADPARACLTPTITTGARRGAPAPDGEVAYAITSGNIVRVDLVADVGGYDEGLFIDCVDFDFCLRLRRRGHRVYRVDDARLRHRLGEAREVPRWAARFYAMHAPARRYYQFRNFLYLAERHLLAFPGFIAKLGVLQLMLVPLIGMFDREPLRSYAAAARGVAHWALRRTGPMPEAAQ